MSDISTVTPTAQTVSIPNMVDNQAAMNAKIPDYFNNMMDNGLANYNQSYNNLASLPGQIDDWTAESLKRQRVTGDMATNAFNSVANQRAGTGIMGGTETQNLNAGSAANIAQVILENQNNIQNTANSLKAGTIQNTPSVAMQPVTSGLGLYGTTANEAMNWGNLAMQTLLSGY